MCVGGFENTIVLFIANQRLHFPAHKTAAPRVKYELILNTRELMPPSIKHKSHLELMTSQRNEAMRVRPALHTHYVQVNTCWHFPHHSGGGRGDERGGGVGESEASVGRYRARCQCPRVCTLTCMCAARTGP